ncbi:MAG: hypothetical protein ABSG91_16310 [Syntrophobacteraceae bacterium]
MNQHDGLTLAVVLEVDINRPGVSLTDRVSRQEMGIPDCRRVVVSLERGPVPSEPGWETTGYRF